MNSERMKYYVYIKYTVNLKSNATFCTNIVVEMQLSKNEPKLSPLAL